jgi:hypothetical protein
MIDSIFVGMLGGFGMLLGWALGHFVLGPWEDRRLQRKRDKDK